MKLRNVTTKKIEERKEWKPTDWLDYINDEDLRSAVPIGPGFQAYVPDWTGPPDKSYLSESSRWLGTTMWSTNGGRAKITKEDVVGLGRPTVCFCAYPGSVECVKRHVNDKSMRLLIDLGPTYLKWKFDEMGEAFSKSWNEKDQRKFDTLVQQNPTSRGKSFIEPGLKCFPAKTRKTLVSYYFNVYVHRQMAVNTRSGCRKIDTDGEVEEERLKSKSSRKRCLDSVSSCNWIAVKTRYLNGRR